MNRVKIIPLDTTEDIDVTAVGGKAASLIRLKRIGLAVPSGFCITSSAFREHLEKNNLIGHIEGALDKVMGVSAKAVRSLLADLRRAIAEAPLAEGLGGKIEKHYSTLGAERVAVRSSATAEDLPGHSFAGQYETYLGIADLDGCIDAVKKCWASLWTERAYDYRQKNAFDHRAVNMAVIVQSLIEADASGVIFTADPVNGYKSRIIIEIVPGLGDPLVSGKATPLRLVIDKKTLRIISRTTSDKKINEELSKVLGDETIIKKLAKQAKKAESKFGCPQDIEWAISDNKIFFLQARPITVIPLQKSWEERQVWTNANTGEVLPDVATPITWSLIQTLLNEIFDRTFSLVAISRGQNPLFERIAGRLYFNINTLVAVLKILPVLQRLDFNKFFGGEHERMYILGQLDIPDEDIPNLEFSFVKFMLKVPGLAFRILTYTPRRGELMIAELKSQIDHLPNIDIGAMNEEKLAKCFLTEITGLRKALVDARYGAIYSVIGLAALPVLHKFCTKWLGDTNGTIANSLLVGVGNMDSAQAALDLWRLAQKAHEIVEVEKTILSDDDWKAIRKKISEIPKGEQFLESWDEFMSRHGHHCRGEMEFFNPRWSETSDYILGIIRSYITSIDKSDPVENYRKHILQRDELIKRYRQRLKNPIKRLVFNYILNHAQRFSVIRENSKSTFVGLIMRWRKMLIELGKRLHNSEILSDAEDIFFLRLKEIEPVTQNKADFDIKKTIASRCAEYEKNKSVMPPKVVIGKFNPDDYTHDAVDTNAEVLNGLAVSSGVVTGKARVILKADTDEQVLPSEVLVAPFTDPGWTPYFMPAAAIVMDIGGMLSHGSIIAREYGIPAVVNVGPATKIIKTGQTIQVDANRGVVKILR